MRDNRLAATLIANGRDIVLIPLYTPLKTDEADVSTPDILFGGINVYLKNASGLFRHLPGFLERWLDSPGMLGQVEKIASGTDPSGLGGLTVSVLRGDDGSLKSESDKLIESLRPINADVVNIPNLMFAGLAGPIRAQLGKPVVCTLSGEDIFLDELPEPHRTEAFQLIRQASANIHTFVSLTEYYADHTARHFGIPREKIRVVPMGLRVTDFKPATVLEPRPFTIGFLARICRAKGLHRIVDAFGEIRRRGRTCRLHVAGYVGKAERVYLKETMERIEPGDRENLVSFHGEVDRAEKADFLRSIDVLSVPTEYHEAKGYFILESLAAGVPFVQPDHGSFVELHEATGGGLLFPSASEEALVDRLIELMDDVDLREGLGRQGRHVVTSEFTDEIMADRMWQLYQQVARDAPGMDA
ncbi:MAG: glycosyltransferase family 4 protein [Planctomycetota bacterium]|jgi:glycosyltransferase involved in cell wall biosynthesis